MDFVGSCNGLICIGSPPIGKAFILWNPAIKLFKFVRISAEIGLRIPMDVSLGFGYDGEGDDFKVVRIARFKIEDNQTEVRIEVYSSISDSWRMIDVDFQFNVVSTKNDAIVNGNPYWIAHSDIGKYLVCFDVKKMVLSIFPLPHFGLNLQGGVDVPLVDWKGSLGAIVCNKNGQGRVEIVVDGALKRSFVIDGYAESLAFLQGMQKVVVRNDEGFFGDDNGDSGAEAEMGDFDIASLLGVYSVLSAFELRWYHRIMLMCFAMFLAS